jgi:hypothetical protein
MMITRPITITTNTIPITIPVGTPDVSEIASSSDIDFGGSSTGSPSADGFSVSVVGVFPWETGG